MLTRMTTDNVQWLELKFQVRQQIKAGLPFIFRHVTFKKATYYAYVSISHV